MNGNAVINIGMNVGRTSHSLYIPSLSSISYVAFEILSFICFEESDLATFTVGGGPFLNGCEALPY